MASMISMIKESPVFSPMISKSELKHLIDEEVRCNQI